MQSLQLSSKTKAITTSYKKVSSSQKLKRSILLVLSHVILHKSAHTFFTAIFGYTIYLYTKPSMNIQRYVRLLRKNKYGYYYH